MGEMMRKQDLLDVLETEWGRWEAALAQVAPDRMEEPGVTGDWSLKDVAAHLTAWESRPVAWLAAIRAGTEPTPAPWPDELDDFDQVNAWIYAANQARTLNDVLTQMRQVHHDLVQGLQLLPEEDLTASGRYPWLEGKSVLGAIGGDTYEHYRGHSESVRNWVSARDRR